MGGDTADNVDFIDAMNRWLPFVFAFVLGLSFVLLTIVFRSIVIAGTSIVLNLLSVGAAYGLVILVFRHGIGNGLFGFQRVSAIEAWVPLFLFSVLFGLSMDYQVFLLSRIKERYDATGSTTDAVTHTVSSTARLITGAALIIVAVFSGFARGRPRHVPADGLRRGGRAADRRDDHPLGAPSSGDEAPRRLELVPAALARVATQDRGRDASRGACTSAKPGKLSGHAEVLAPSTRRSGARSALVLELAELHTTDLAGQCLREIVDEFDLARVGVR